MAETRVILCDDDPDIRSLCRSGLERQGFVVEEVGDGSELMERLRASETPAAIVLDIIMPEQTGWATLKELRSDPELASIPVVFLTSHDDDAFKRRAREMGVTEYLTKPVPPHAVVNAVRSMLWGKRDHWAT